MSKAWKNLEYDVAKLLGGKRIIRQSYSDKKPDVYLDDFPNFKIDTKRRKKSSALSLHKEVKERYCEKPKHEAVVVIRQHRKKTSLAVIDIKLLAKFINFIRKKGGQDEFR